MDTGASSPTITLPNFIYVSELLRTWETAVLLFLSLTNINLTLYISPFLREKPTLIPSLVLRKQELFPSDVPGELKEQVREFVRFIAFLRELKKLYIDGISELIPEKFSIILKHFGGEFTSEHFASIETPEGVTLSISDGGIQIACNFSENTGLPSRLDGIKQSNIVKMFQVIEVDANSVYVPYTEVSSEPALQIPNASSVPNVGNMDTPSTPAGSLANFVDWYNSLTTKPHGDGDIVTAVSHSGTMKTFVKQVEELNSSPSQQFETAYEEAIGTNTCSLVFKNEGLTFNIFRHAHSCDNRNMHKGTITSTSKRFGDSGKYASLSLWGILSTLKFSNKKLNALITTQEITSPSGLKICRGMVKETSEYLTDSYDSMNMLCGEQRDRMPIGNFSLSLGHCGTSGGLLPTLDKNCIRIITTDPKGPKVVLYLDKEKEVIQARFFLSAETSTTYEKENTRTLKLQTLSETLGNIIRWLASDVNITLELKNELMKSINLFINSDKDIKSRWGIAFDALHAQFNTPANQQELMKQRQQQLREEQRQKFIAGLNAAHTAVKDLNILDETKCIKITANEDGTNEFTLDLVNCARPNMEQEHVSSSTFALLFLDKDKRKIECKFFQNNTSNGINFSFDDEQPLGTYLVNILTGLGVIDNEKQKSLKLKLIKSIKIFIESNTEIDSEWKELLMPLYQSYIDKKDEKASAFVDSSSQELLALHISAGGTNKRTRRHRRRHGNHKVIRKYTRKNKKYNPRRKSRRIQKRKQTHKRKLGKSRKSRKSCKSRK
jgi:hypothetical protein